MNRFFEELDRQLSRPATIILVGGAAALLLGGVRPTQDVDFSIQTKEAPSIVARGILFSEKQSGLQSEYSSDIERWSMLNLLDYRKHVRPYKKFGKVNVTILEPEYWSIGKMGRYYDSDIQDMVSVFKNQNTQLSPLVSVWKKVIKDSPLSDDLFHFKKHIEHFLNHFGGQFWTEKEMGSAANIFFTQI